jgi:hypothetical protein
MRKERRHCEIIEYGKQYLNLVVSHQMPQLHSGRNSYIFPRELKHSPDISVNVDSFHCYFPIRLSF